MNENVKQSLSRAEEVLSGEELDELALVIEEFANSRRAKMESPFSEAELAELKTLAAKPSNPVAKSEIDEIYARHGL